MHQQARATLHYGLCPDVEAFFLLKQQQNVTFPDLVVPQDRDFRDIYTDGTRVVHNGRSKLLCRGLVPGLEQSPYRGECFAILQSLQHRFACRLHLDCAAALQLLQTLLRKRRTCDPYKHAGHDDIWHRIWWHLLQRPPDTISCTKVKAHVQWKLLDDPCLREQGRLNDLVDRDAKQAVVLDHRDLFQRLERGRNDHVRQADFNVKELHSFWTWSGKAALAEHPPPEQLLGWVMPTPDQVQPRGRPLDILALDPAVLLDAGFPFGDTFCQRLCAFWNDLVWIRDSTAISMVELYVAFTGTTGNSVPVRICKKPLTWALRDPNVLADITPTGLGAQARTRRMVWKWIQGVTPAAFPGPWVDRCDSLHLLGYKRCFLGLPCRPVLPYTTFQQLWRYLHPPGGNMHTLAKAWFPFPPGAVGGA